MFRIAPAVLLLGILFPAIAGLTASFAQETEEPELGKESTESAEVPKKLFSGKVLLLGEALKEKGIKSYEEMHKQAALVTPDQEIIPIIADWRGRAFFQDERLRNRKVELVGMRKPGVPYLQVLSVFTFDEKGERMYTDYWCDICAIPMYEVKPCDCCQAEIRLRFQPKELPSYLPEVKEKKSPAGEIHP